MTYPTSTLDRLRLRSDVHAERTQARKARTRKPAPSATVINRAEREVMHYRSLAEEWESDAELLRQDPTYGPLSSQTTRAEGMAAQARKDEVAARAALDALLRAQGEEVER